MLTIRNLKPSIELGENLVNGRLDAATIEISYKKATDTKNANIKFPYGDNLDNYDVKAGRACFVYRRPRITGKNEPYNDALDVNQTLNGLELNDYKSSHHLMQEMVFAGIAKEPMNAKDLDVFASKRGINDKDDALLTTCRLNKEGKVNIDGICPFGLEFGQYVRFWVPDFDISKKKDKDGMDQDKFNGLVENNFYGQGTKKNPRIEPLIVAADDYERGLNLSSLNKLTIGREKNGKSISPTKYYDIEQRNDENIKKLTSLEKTIQFSEVAQLGFGFQFLYHLVSEGYISIDTDKKHIFEEERKNIVHLAMVFGMIGGKEDDTQEKEKDDNLNKFNEFKNKINLKDKNFKDDVGYDELTKEFYKNIFNSVDIFDAMNKNIQAINRQQIFGKVVKSCQKSTKRQTIEIDLIQ